MIELITPHFSSKELECPCCGLFNMPKRTQDRLEAARLIYNKAITVESACRCKKENLRVGGKENSAHLPGYAIDPSKPSDAGDLMALDDAFMAAGFHRKGIGGNQLHYDDHPDRRRAMWTY